MRHNLPKMGSAQKMYKLYARKGAGSAAVEAFLAGLGVDHEIVEVEKNRDGTFPDWFMAINPRAEIPALELSDKSLMTESAAMMIHLADAHPEAGLAPTVGTPARAQYLRWLLYMASAAYNSDLRMYYPQRYSLDPSHADGIKAKAIIDLARDFDIFAKEMGEGPFILGDKMCAADIYVAMLLVWSNDVDGLFAKHPKLKRLYDGVSALPAVRKAWDRNGMR
jgi:glutathione S-transferase